MNRCKAISLLLILIPTLSLAQQKAKKHTDVPAVFQNARFVYVEAMDGDAIKPGLYPADRQAIFDVEDSLRDWNRYALVTRREDADLVLVVRKGRLASAQVHGGVSVGTRLPTGSDSNSGRAPGQAGPVGDGSSVGVEGEVGPAIDILRVYLVSSDGNLTTPVWAREFQDGLDPPAVLLIQQLRTAVERAYPSQPPAAKKQTP